VFPDDGPEDWHKSPVDPCSLLGAFPALRLRPGYTLRAYSFGESGNGDAFVYATPMDPPFPEPEECPRDGSRFLDPPIPPGALGDLMDAIEGDGSVLALLSASLFGREVREFGAR
jgi:hypothetical protein